MPSRPDFHFTPPLNWMNDPNGLIYHEGLYHVYYQHNPLANEFGNISWGHATSRDLKTWNHHEVALRFTAEAMIYSGCTVRDRAGNICAIYTEHLGDTEDYHERICLARSHDGGFSFDQEERQIILERQENDFRDPKVFWYEAGQYWVMCVALPKQYTILFYRSTDLYSWTPSGEFTSSEPHGQFWECPDLFPLLDEAGQETWVLTLSGQNSDGQSWGMFYFVGFFDGHAFQAQGPSMVLDHGSDFYAGVTFEGLNERVMLGWAGNWAYAGQLSEGTFSGVMAIPRKLSLHKGMLYQELISDLEAIPLEVKLEPQKLGIENCSLEWRSNGLTIDRSNSPRKFPETYRVVNFEGKIQQLHLWKDNGIWELSINDGQQMMTVRV